MDRIKLPVTMQQVFNMQDMSIERLERACSVLLCIADADGIVPKPEKGWMVNTLESFSCPPELIERLREFDYKSADLMETLNTLGEDDQIHV